ncbi:juvenile hormone acid O-methyltransferase isoform X2 [Diachasma alloeum]|uniref:juvenile hormone acid O-methyltransferase isoform X2 n=1 Tax=Diachasma alloeum TaxID=454923 RepID=UPI0007381B36|nr:juvenile hormone acid O-methyltransferase isoform X2 [Diachasma alloeum]
MNRPEEYAASNGLQYRDVNNLIKEFPEDFREMQGRVIDVGCGPGNITKDLLLPNVGKDAMVIGADLCAAMIEYAKQHYEFKDKLSFIQLDIETPELSNNLIGQFDNAVSFYCLQWCRNTKLTMENFYKLLRSGGKAIVLMVSHYMIFDIYSEQQKDPKFAAYMQDFLKFTPPHHGYPNAEEMLREDLKEVGFEILHCTNRWKTFMYLSLDSLIF